MEQIELEIRTAISQIRSNPFGAEMNLRTALTLIAIDAKRETITTKQLDKIYCPICKLHTLETTPKRKILCTNCYTYFIPIE